VRKTASIIFLFIRHKKPGPSFPAKAGSSMGLACPALRESEFSGSAKRIDARV